MRPKHTFKILVTSPKGGVGKSTISANLAAFIQSNGQSVTLLDFDNHGSSSSWLKRAPNVGVVIQHHPLPLNQGGNRSLLDARLHLRRAAVSTDVVICDLTWSNSIAGELMFEYDLVIVPTSVSEIELAATVGFLSHHHWVFDSAIHTPPLLLLPNTRTNGANGQRCVYQTALSRAFYIATAHLGSSKCKKYVRAWLFDGYARCLRSVVCRIWKSGHRNAIHPRSKSKSSQNANEPSGTQTQRIGENKFDFEQRFATRTSPGS